MKINKLVPDWAGEFCAVKSRAEATFKCEPTGVYKFLPSSPLLKLSSLNLRVL
jgi:hypothetical protein